MLLSTTVLYPCYLFINHTVNVLQHIPAYRVEQFRDRVPLFSHLVVPDLYAEGM